MVMEIMSGGEMFAEVVDNGGLPLDDRGPEGRRVPGARSYARQILLGLAYCHKRSIAHRDIKLENLLLSADRQTVKIADFGLAKISTGGADMTILGTIKYVPTTALLHSSLAARKRGTRVPASGAIKMWPITLRRNRRGAGTCRRKCLKAARPVGTIIGSQTSGQLVFASTA